MPRTARVGLGIGVTALTLVALAGCSTGGAAVTTPVTAAPAPATPAAGSTPTAPAPGTSEVRTPTVLPTDLDDAVAFDDGNTLDLISCSRITVAGAATAYRLSLVADELIDVALDGAGEVIKVSVPTASPELIAESVSGGTEGTVVTGSARFAPDDLDWDGFTFAFDSANCV